MGVVNTKATAISNADQIYPRIMTGPWLSKGPMFCAAGAVNLDTNDSSGSVYRFIRVPSNARIHRLEIFSDAISGATSATVGVYAVQDSSGNQGAAVSAALFGTGIDLSIAQTEPYDVIFNNLSIANIEKRVWELLGLAADPNVMYDICIVGTTLSSSTGYLAMRGDYTI